MRSVIISCLLLTFVTGACRKESADAPEALSVTAENLTYRAGDTVIFHLTGDPGILVFFSGEPGKRYEHRARSHGAGAAKLVFQSSMQQGPVPPAVSEDSLQLLISTDLEGYDAEHINKATWTSVTGRNKKWPANLSTAMTTSDSIDISDFNEADSVNIAFRILGKKTGVTAQRKWAIQNLTLTNTLPDGTVSPVLSNFANTGWVQASLKNDNDPGTEENGYAGFNAWNVGTWGISAATTIRNSNGIPIRSSYPITFSPGNKADNEDNDDWLITTAVDLKTVKPDGGMVIKKETALKLDAYEYIFKKAGTYEVAFMGVNSSLQDSKSVVRQLTITILP